MFKAGWRKFVVGTAGAMLLLLVSTVFADSKQIVRSTSTGSDGTTYYVAICANNNSGSGSLSLGHAFVKWFRKRGSVTTVDRVRGFYPVSKLLALAAPFNGVTSYVRNDSDQVATETLTVQVSPSAYSRSQSVADAWSGNRIAYSLHSQNCISFAQSVARDIGLNGANARVYRVLPRDAVRSLMNANN